MSKIIDLEIAEEKILKTHSGNISMKNYVSARKLANFHCNVCGNDWTAQPSQVWNGRGCRICHYAKLSIIKRFDYNFVKEFIESEGCQLISDNYINNSQKLDIIFECGHQGKMSFHCFSRGQRCAICKPDRISAVQRMLIEKILGILTQKGLTFIEFPNGYSNQKSIVKCVCDNGHIQEKTLSSIQQFKGCVLCHPFWPHKNKRRNSMRNGEKWGIYKFLKGQIKQWKKDSMKNCGYHCILCGEGSDFENIHHLYNFFALVKETLAEFGNNGRLLVSDFTGEELTILSDLILQKHYEHPLGVCLCAIHHSAFHQKYGRHNNTPSQFEEFKQLVASEQQILIS